MTLKIEFKTDSSAFDWNMKVETSWMLREVSDRIDGGSKEGDIWDSGGNIIGNFELTD